MTFTYDFVTEPDVSRVRLLITDTDSTLAIFSDEELEVFLEMSGDSLRLAAAQALDVIASSETLIQKVITNLGLSTNGPAVAASLREHAKELRRQDVEGEGEEDSGEGWMDIAEQVYEPFGYRERIIKQAQRLGW